MVAFRGVAALAQPYPSKPIRMVMSVRPRLGHRHDRRGMSTDRAGRMLGTTFVVDNRPGANGMLAAREVLKAPTDGYTLMMSSNSAHAANSISTRTSTTTR